MTSAAKHTFTAGPWSVDDEDLSSKVRAPDGTMLALAHQYRSGNIGADERKANARLIAAAPELFEARRRKRDAAAKRKAAKTKGRKP